MVGGLPKFSGGDLDPEGDDYLGEGYWIFIPWAIALVVLEALPLFGVECLLGWCVVTSIHWKIIAAILAFGLLLACAAVAALISRLR